MKVSLISPYPDITSFGVRTLSAYLREHGHSTQLIFLPDPFGDDIVHGAARYPGRALDDVVELCRDSGLVGIALMTNFFDGAVEITAKLKAGLDVPVIWGGVHPTVRPEESLEHADMVCVGEGEDCLLELANHLAAGSDYRQTPNLWVRDGEQVTRNPLSGLPRELDVYPMPDYSMQDHHIMLEGRVVPLDHDLTRNYLERGTVAQYIGKIGYQTMTSRGCPFSCTYCINDAVKKMYGGKGRLRWRSIEHVMDELLWVRENMPYVGFIWISDDDFMARKMSDIDEFCRRYKAEIGFPFSCLVSPLTIREDKMSKLVEAGLVYVQMGIESGSVRMQKLFKREHTTNEKVLEAARVINRYADRMFPPSYDFLLDVPYETDADRLDSLRLIAQLPKPYRLQPFALIPYPGTEMYEMVTRDGLIQDERREIYSKSYTMAAPRYLNLVMMVAKSGKCPSGLLRFLISGPVVAVLNSAVMRPAVRGVYAGLRGTRHILRKVLRR